MHRFWLDEDGSCPRWCARRMRFPWCEKTHSAAWAMPSRPEEAEYGVTGDMPSAAAFTMSMCVTASCHLACGQSDPNLQCVRMRDVISCWPLPGQATSPSTPMHTQAHPAWLTITGVPTNVLFQHLAPICTETLQRAPPTHTWFILHTHYHYTPSLSCIHIVTRCTHSSTHSQLTVVHVHTHSHTMLPT